MERISEHYSELSGEAKARYTAKVCGVGLKTDPYAIPSELWADEPEEVPDVAWSDMFMYMIATPSAYTREEMKVSLQPDSRSPASYL